MLLCTSQKVIAAMWDCGFKELNHPP